MVSHSLNKKKTRKILTSPRCRASDSLQDCIYGYSWEFHFSESFFIARNNLSLGGMGYEWNNIIAKTWTKMHYFIVRM